MATPRTMDRIAAINAAVNVTLANALEQAADLLGECEDFAVRDTTMAEKSAVAHEYWGSLCGAPGCWRVHLVEEQPCR